MKRSIFALALLASFTVAAQPSNLFILKKSFNEMQPLSIKDSNGVITVVLDAASITPEIYDTAVYSVCSPAWLHKENTAYLKNTTSVRILNKFSAMGYVLEKPKATCDKAGEEQEEQSKITILSNTHVTTMKDLQ
ncbi:hypothetical protein AI2943V1_1280 [Klebsiella oxytoca]|uniref:hypothetical protein n=1 Tax=Klebsiella TaxID=570 RepID=UPI0007CC0728|nr:MULTISPECIES: hypothetical protein [Klebsiella]CAF2851575.1 hypothetical protein AI2943V1_1280 [Klebsiella oxytoca]HDU4462849.1 hypothetical protein [Klebsiella pneumoniae subsp. pneumoniae]QND03153.1 hypothetical protein F3090_06330 [Klebsiella pneumoniae]UMI04937.1 hypothetical protein JJ465_06350 [Klebsiella pneumoniae]CAH5634310.1 hypothetical protein AI2943V1_1280 [Klebsiella oxytoca]